MLFSIFDRRGGRRVGMALSGSIGRRVERWLLSSADMVLTFSNMGAQSLSARCSHSRVRPIPLPIDRLPDLPKDPAVYCPARLSADDLDPVLTAFETGSIPSRFRLRVGNLSESERHRVEQRFRAVGLGHRLEFTGFLDQAGLDRSYATATAVIRLRSRTSSPANLAAASGPILSGLAAGCAVASNDARGSAACLDIAGVNLVGEDGTFAEQLAQLLADPSRLNRLAVAARAHVEATHAPARVARYLQAILDQPNLGRFDSRIPVIDGSG
jgi:glycosyltransferase involved in cell wall biosynthesis